MIGFFYLKSLNELIIGMLGGVTGICEIILGFIGQPLKFSRAFFVPNFIGKFLTALFAHNKALLSEKNVLSAVKMSAFGAKELSWNSARPRFS